MSLCCVINTTKLARRNPRRHMRPQLPDACAPGMPLATELLGLAAGSLSVVCFVPQAVQIYQGHDTEDLSLASFSALLVAAVLWMSYGVARADWPLIATNAFQLLIIVYIIARILSNTRARSTGLGQPLHTVEIEEGQHTGTAESQ